MTAILHIAPQLPPAICGVGDYATLVGARMEQLFPEVRCAYLACGHQLANGFVVRDGRQTIGSADPHAFWAAVKARFDEIGAGNNGFAIVVHYVGYGYDRGGVPAWLADALERRPAWFAAGRIVTFFHELYATGWPWQRAFWSSRRQREVAVRVARASDELATNREQSARWLEKVTGRANDSVAYLPVFSNVGEPIELPLWDERPRRATTFGGAARKRYALQTHARHIARLLRRVGVEELIDIGPHCIVDEAAFQSEGVAVKTLGVLDSTEISKQMANCRFGLVDYRVAAIAKSGVLAAFAAHGMAPVMVKGPAPAKKTQLPLTILSFSDLAAQYSGERVRRYASDFLAWYRSHDQQKHAELLAKIACGDVASYDFQPVTSIS